MKRRSEIMVSYILILALFFVALPVKAAEKGNGVLKLDNLQMTVEMGNTFDVTLSIDDNPGIMGLDMIVEYEKKYIEPIEVSAGIVLKDETINDSIDTSTTNSFHIMWAGSENVTANGVLFTVKFNSKINPQVKNTYISFKSNAENTYNESYESVILGDAVLNVRVTTTDVKKYPELAVYMEDWIAGEHPSTPFLTGNIESGAVTYEYSSSPYGTYSKDVPTEVGKYYLRATVAETNHYRSGVTTCTFRILKKSTPTLAKNTPKPSSPSDNAVKSKMKINLKKKTYKISYKVIVKSAAKIKRIKLNGKTIKNANGRKKCTFKLSKYKKYLRKRKWNKIKVWDVNGKKVTKKFKVKMK